MKFKKIFLLLFPLLLSSCNLLIPDFSQGPGTQIIHGERLDTPRNVVFDDENYCLTWDAVGNATSYYVSINSVETKVETTCFEFIPSLEHNEFKVKAYDDTGNYLTSEWSNTVTYDLNKNTINEATLLNFATTIEEYDTVLEVLFLYIYSPEEVRMYLEKSIGNDDKYIGFYKIEYEGMTITTLEDILTKTPTYSFEGKSMNETSWKTIEYYMQCNDYCGLLGQYVQNGYTIEVVNAHTSENEDGNIKTDSKTYVVFRATRDDQVVYFWEIIEIYVMDEYASTNQRLNYTTKITNANQFYQYCHAKGVFEGDFYDYIDGVYQRTVKTN